MIRTLFDRTKPEFIGLKDGCFNFKGTQHARLRVFIKQLVPIRKRFDGRKLVCASYNGTTGRNGKTCAFCPQRNECHERLRLNLLITSVEAEPVPASLEIRAGLFHALDEAIATAGEEHLDTTLFELEATAEGTKTMISFTPIF